MSGENYSQMEDESSVCTLRSFMQTQLLQKQNPLDIISRFELSAPLETMLIPNPSGSTVSRLPEKLVYAYLFCQQ